MHPSRHLGLLHLDLDLSKAPGFERIRGVLDRGLIDKARHDQPKGYLGFVHCLLELSRLQHPGGADDGLPRHSHRVRHDRADNNRDA